MKLKTLLIAFTLGAFTLQATAQQMSYQGRITDSSGNPVTGNQTTLTFTIWDAPTGGTQVWGPFERNADLIDSRFSLKIGPTDSTERSLTDAFGSETRYIQVQVAQDTPLPRQEVLNSPNALFAVNAENAEVAETLVSRSGDVFNEISRENGPHRGNGANRSFGSIGLVIESANGLDASGLYLGENTAALYSPGNSSEPLFSVYDEDTLGSSTSEPVFEVTNTGGLFSEGDVHIEGDTSVLTSNFETGALVIGSNFSNIALDGNEVRARSNNSDATLFLNFNSGPVRVGSGDSGLSVNRGLSPNAATQFQMAPDDDFVSIGHDAAGATIYQITDNAFFMFGDASKNSGGTSWDTFSDQRLKKDVKDYEYGLQEIVALNTVRFRYKDDKEMGLSSENENIGFIAQEVQKVIPEAVSVGTNDYLSLNADPIHWAAINAIQELNTIIETQKSSLSAQSSEIDSLKANYTALQEEMQNLAKTVSALEETTAHTTQVTTN